MMESLEQTEAYPNARNAIGWLKIVDKQENIFALLRHSTAPIEVIINRFTTACDESLGDHYDAMILAAKPEFQTEDFRRYLMAVVYGAM